MKSKFDFIKNRNILFVIRRDPPESIGRIRTYNNLVVFDPLMLLDDSLTISELRQIADFREKQGGVISLILKKELEKVEQWIEQVEKDGTAQTIINRNKTSEISSVEFLVKENTRYRQAGLQLARAAMYVIEHYDGLHRLSKAVSDWMLTIYNEGGRGEE
jgi:hypothetical protein